MKKSQKSQEKSQELIFENEFINKKYSSFDKELLKQYTNSYINDKLKEIELIKNPLQQISEINKLFYYDPTCFYLYFLIGSIYEKLVSSPTNFSEPKLESKLEYIDLAKSYYSMCMHHNDKFTDAYIKLALVYKLESELRTTEYNNLEIDKNNKYPIDKYSNGIKFLEIATKKFPDDDRLKNSLGVMYIESGQYKKAESTMDEIIKKKNTDVGIRIDVLHNTGTFTLDNYKALSYLNESEKLLFSAENRINISTLQNKLLRLNRIYTKDITDTSDDIDYIYKQHLKINYVFSSVKRYEHKNRESNPGKKIKLGYVSSDFKNHVITKYMFGPLKYHDRNKFEIFCYYNGTYNGTEFEKTTQEYKKMDLTFREIKNLSDDNAAEIIYNDKIDILIDLNGHTEGNRIGIFARKPAPIQITYLGYPNTTGLKEMDYRITDIYSDPIDSKQKYSEKLLRLSRCFFCYDPNDVKSDLYKKFISNGPIDVPIKLKKIKDAIVIASINKITKNSKQTIETWAEILKRAPELKILVKFDQDELFMIPEYLKLLNIPKERMIIVNLTKEQRQFNISYYNIFNEVDILLDPFPYTGTTTTCDSLYMSTPLITLTKKNYHVHNVSASILTHMNCTELIASTTEEYIQKCIDLARNKERLLMYKQELRQKLLNIMSLDNFMQEYENILTSLII